MRPSSSSPNWYEASSHITLMMPNASAAPSPKIQVKYHILYSPSSSVERVTSVLDVLDGHLAAHDSVHPARIKQNQGEEDDRGPEHYLQRAVTRHGVPYRQAAGRIRGRRHDERKQREPGG